MNIKEIEKRQGAHSIFSPSASKMWLTCPGSLIPNLLADNPTNHAAAEGTVAHGVAEEWLKSGRKPRHMIGKIETISDKLGNSFDIEITPEMIGYVQEYVDYVNSLDGEKHIEIRVDLSDFTPIDNQGGTADCINFDGDVLRIVDFKYGQGVHVDAFENTQMQTYALGAHAKYGHLVSIPLKSGRCCKYNTNVLRLLKRLNPFEVREVLQEGSVALRNIP